MAWLNMALDFIPRMATLLIVRKYAEAARAKSFVELWRTLNNDQCAELSDLFCQATGRTLDPFFQQATDEDWLSMSTVIANLKPIVVKLNDLLRDADWRNQAEIASLLEGAKQDDLATGKPREYVAMAASVANRVKFHVTIGGDAGGFGESCLFDLRTVSAPPTLDLSSYDLFISYKTKRHARRAARLAEHLGARGYRVWFDHTALNRMVNRPEIFEAEYLLSVLVNGVKCSRCTIIFEAVARAVALRSGRTEEQAIAERTAMRDANGALVAWDWQGIEIAATERGITIHPQAVAVFDTKSGAPARFIRYEDENGLLTAIHAALAHLGIESHVKSSKNDEA